MANIKTHIPADFFVLRTPKLSLKRLLDWHNLDCTGLRESLRLWLEEPETQEALYIASPSLLQRIEQWYDDPDSKKGKKLEQVLTKYFIRMAGRATPFGLFSGLSMGHIKNQTRLELMSSIPVKRKTRLDMHYLMLFKEQLCQKHWPANKFVLKTNSTTYQMGNQLRYIESYYANEQLHYRLSSVEYCEFIQSVLTKAERGVFSSDLVDFLCQQNIEISSVDALEYIEQLVDARLLIPQLSLPLTGSSSDKCFAESLSKAGFEEYSEQILGTLDDLKDIDKSVCNSPLRYQSIFNKLRQLPFPIKENKLFQVDYFSPNSDLSLDKKLCEKVIDDLVLLQKLSAHSTNPLQHVITKINTDYIGRMMPLQEFLDDETGTGMGTNKAFATPLLKGLNLNSCEFSELTFQISFLDRLLMQAITSMEQPNQVEITLSQRRINDFVNSHPQSLPDSLAIMLQLFEGKKEEEPQIFFKGCYGPSAANLLGRFCHLDDSLLTQVRELLKKEEASNPNTLYAEIVHLPEGRIGNVIARPVLRQYEIPFISDSGVNDEFQLDLEDLFVYIESSKVKLWSKEHNKEVIPRLSSAHNYTSRSLGIYTFLCMLQNQNTCLPRFAWSSIFDTVDYLPRVKLGDLLLSKRRWRIERKELEALNDSISKNENWQTLQTKHRLPEWVSYSVSDNTLIINLTNSLMLAVLLAETKGKNRVLLEEVLDVELQPLSSLDGEPLKHEIILPLIRDSSSQTDNPAISPSINMHHLKASNAHRSFGPGSEWLSVKIYVGNSSAERLIAEVISSLVGELKRKKFIHGFFFLRYGDPDWHIRLRFSGDPQTLLTEVLPCLHQTIEPLRLNGPVNNIVLDTYEQEVERYGGLQAITLAERLFSINSSLCLKLLAEVNGMPDEYRWRSVILGCDNLLASFGFNTTQKLDFITQLRDAGGREFGDSAPLRKALGKKYREYQTSIRADLELEQTDKVVSSWMAMFEKHKMALLSIVKEYNQLEENEQLTVPLFSILSAILHMFNNRMFIAYGRQQEFVVYDLLRRYYEYRYNYENKRK